MADYTTLIAKYFPANQVLNALRVMQGESGGDPYAHATQGEDSRGLFQINLDAHPQWANLNLYDPETNVRLAAQLYQSQGWQPWTVARNLGLTGTTPIAGGTPMAEPITDLSTEAAKLKAEIDRLTAVAQQRDADGDPTYEAMQAEKRLPQLRDDYRQVLQIIATQTKPKATEPMPTYADDYSVSSSEGLQQGTTRQPYAAVKQIGNSLYGLRPGGTQYELIQTFPKDPQTLAPRYPEDAEYAGLRNAKLRQELMNPYLLAQQQHDEAINAIHARMLLPGTDPNHIDAAQANKLMDLTRQNLQATLMGTSPWQMRTQQQGLAKGVLGEQMQLGGNLAGSLLSNIQSANQNIYSGAGPYTPIDPFALAKYGQETLGVNPQMSDLAKSILMSGMQGGF